MPVINVMEQIVADKLESFLEKMDCCKCQECRHDMLAYALNLIDPKYVNSQTGELFIRIDSMRFQNSVDIDIAVSKAIAAVIAFPRHKK